MIRKSGSRFSEKIMFDKTLERDDAFQERSSLSRFATMHPAAGIAVPAGYGRFE
jgi:hypothetical protein